VNSTFDRPQQNKPNSRGPDGTRDEGEMRQTNPIWPGWPGRGAGGGQTPAGHDGAKQSQFPAELREGQVVCRKGVMVHRTCNRLRKNKANLPARPPRGAGRGSHQPSRRCGVLRQTNPISGGRLSPWRCKCAKRTQFQPLRPSRAPIIPTFHHSSIPILGRGRRGNRAKQTQLPEAGHRGGVRPAGPPGSPIVRNKANCPKRGTAPGRGEGSGIRPRRTAALRAPLPAAPG
jgi:hypothetical protein